MQYLSYVTRRLIQNESSRIRDLSYWQDELFIKTTAITIPASLMVMIPSIIIFWGEGSRWIPGVDIFAFSSVSIFILCTKYPIKIKMSFAVFVLTLLAVFLIASLGSFGVGSIYLLAISVIISLLFSDKIAYCSIGVNALIFAVFSLLINEKVVRWTIVNNYKIDVWLIYSLNFLFLNFMIVVEIRHLLVGLQSTMEQENKLLKILQTEVADKTIRNKQLAESEGHYKSLFFNNPSPMWIFDPATFYFLQVNEAAMVKYGFSSEEFLEMTIQQIRVDPVDLIVDRLNNAVANESIFSNVALHRKKNGKQFYAKIRCSTIPFHGHQALLVIAQDITTQISHNKAIEEQNLKLKKIAYFQSHMVRAPLARIKGLWSLWELEERPESDSQLFEFMKMSIEELDTVIRGIIKDSEVVSSVKPRNTRGKEGND